jgi:hypothetical protein
MDTSREYIAMCDEAREIQKNWRPLHGDYFIGERNKLRVWIDGINDPDKVVTGVEVEFRDGIPSLTRYIWLPRLDQLIELAQEAHTRYEQTTQAFLDWTKRDYGTLPGEPRKVFTSLEQTWLAFVMLRKHGKKWNSQTWIPVT